MRYLLIVLLGFLSSSLTWTQPLDRNVSIEATSGNNLKILNAYPDSFPSISIVFEAEHGGDPVWDLEMDEIRVYEDNEACTLLSLEPISKRKPIHISLVLDHSGSMERDVSQLYVDSDWTQPLFSIDSEGHIIYPEGYITPLENAKSSIKNFIGKFDLEKDYVGLIGFSTDIDVRIPLTNDTSLINATIDTIQPTLSTALYDAAYEALGQLRGKDGIGIEVLLTDGLDNASSKHWTDIVDLAIAEEVPIFIIGLGDVNVDTLSLIAQETKGEFFHATNAKFLDSIYTKISRKILSFYDLRYESINAASIDDSRQIRLEFDIDEDFLVVDSTSIKLPPEVISYLEKKERQRTYFVYGGIATILLILGGVLIVNYRKTEIQEEETDSLLITRVYPNPSPGIINVIHSADDGFLVVRDTTGREVKRHKINAKHESIDLYGFSGTYFVIIEAAAGLSKPVQVIIQ